jgi:hypothetical protein
MVIPWLNSIRQTHKLTIFVAQNATSLAPILGTAITRFNALSQSLSLKVTYETSLDSPDPDNLNGANVQLALANGAYTFKGLGADGNGFLAADARKGVTRFVTGGSSEDAKLAKAFIFLPASIQVHDFMKALHDRTRDGARNRPRQRRTHQRCGPRYLLLESHPFGPGRAVWTVCQSGHAAHLDDVPNRGEDSAAVVVEEGSLAAKEFTGVTRFV